MDRRAGRPRPVPARLGDPAARTVTATYGADFFSAIERSSQAAAQRVLPLVFELVAPSSVVDVGCGAGVWLAEAGRLGVGDYLGVDGHTPAGSLRIDADRFLRHDLATPLRLERRFDLVICLEVAEHVEAQAADVLVDSLARLGPAVLFSAAVPQQSGEHHVNEQWPDYWAGRFAARGLVPVDAVRPRIWRDDSVPWWYRQNALLFCEPELVQRPPALRAAAEATRGEQLAVVHPELYSWMAVQRDRLAAEAGRAASLRELVRLLPGAARRA